MTQIVIVSEVPNFTSSFFQVCRNHPFVRVVGISNRIEAARALCEAVTPDALVLVTHNWSSLFVEQECPVLLLSDDRLALRRALWMKYKPLLLQSTTHTSLLKKLTSLTRKTPPIGPQETLTPNAS